MAIVLRKFQKYLKFRNLLFTKIFNVYENAVNLKTLKVNDQKILKEIVTKEKS